MINDTIFTELFLSGLSDLPSLQLPLFIFFLLIYLLTLTWNLLIIIFIVIDSHLHTPMYFFLGNLASLDLCHSSLTVPRMLYDLQTKRRLISTTACLTQVFFFLSFTNSEVFLLAAMSYDRYVAICHPLRYMQIMNWKLCICLAFSAWSVGFINSLLHTLYALNLSFCESNIIESFFCDLPLLFQISCSSIFINIMLIFCVGSFFGTSSLIMIFLPYVSIIKNVLRMTIKSSRKKAFSTCSSHLIVVFLFYGTVFFNYFHSHSESQVIRDKVVSVVYSVITPLLNPLIYSLRNQDLRTAFQEVLVRLISGVRQISP